MECSNVVCRKKCHPSLSKLLKLKQDLADLSREVETISQKSFLNYTSTHHAIRKRPNPDQSPSPHKRLRKEMPNTPIRQFLNTTVVGDKKVLAVRSLCVCAVFSY